MTGRFIPRAIYGVTLFYIAAMMLGAGGWKLNLLAAIK